MLHLVGFFFMNCTMMHRSTNIKFPMQSVNIVNKKFLLTAVHWNELCGHWFNAD